MGTSSLLDPGGRGTMGLSGRSRAGQNVVRAIESSRSCRSGRTEHLCATQRHRPAQSSGTLASGGPASRWTGLPISSHEAMADAHQGSDTPDSIGRCR